MIYDKDTQRYRVVLADTGEVLRYVKSVDTDKRIIERFIQDPYRDNKIAVGKDGVLVVVEHYRVGKYQVWQVVHE